MGSNGSRESPQLLQGVPEAVSKPSACSPGVNAAPRLLPMEGWGAEEPQEQRAPVVGPGVPAGAATQFWVETGGKRLFGGSCAISLVVGLWSEALATALAPHNSSQGRGGGKAGGRLREGRRRPQHAIYGSGGKNAAGLKAEQRAGGARPARGQPASRFPPPAACHSSISSARGAPQLQGGCSREGEEWAHSRHKVCPVPVLPRVLAPSTAEDMKMLWKKAG